MPFVIKGLIFSGIDANVPTQLWIASRYLHSISLLIALFFLRKRLSVNVIFTCYLTVTVLILLSIFSVNIFPDCFVEGRGLTRFKINSEYLISLLFAGTIVLLRRYKKEFDEKVLRLIV